VRRADDLATELQGSRQRLARARDVERKRLVTELAQLTTDRLAALRADVVTARSDLDSGRQDTAAVQEALGHARVELDDLLDRFRVLVRGVYPAVLRDQGPAGALDELAADLPRGVRVSGGLGERLGWEIESGIYYVAAAAVNELAGRPAEQELSVHLERSGGRVVVRIHDPSPTVTVEHARAALAEDVERLAALGGDLELTGYGQGTSVTLLAWLPDRLEPLIDSGVAAVPGVW
jgi:signal transduction histidine kinase